MLPMFKTRIARARPSRLLARLGGGLWRALPSWSPPEPLALPLAALLAGGAGAATVLSFAPFGLAPVPVLTLALLYQTLRGQTPRTALLLGWLFGLGLFGCGVFWIRISLNEFGNLPAPVANLLMVLLVALLALFYALAGGLIRWLQPPAGQSPWVGPLLVLPGVWVLLEWVRGWLFTGFPWLILGTGQVAAPLGGLAPVLGVFGVGLAVALSAGLLWGVWQWRGRARQTAGAALVGVWLLGLILWPVPWTRPLGAPIAASVVQGNVEQSLKWAPDGLLPTLEIYLGLTRDVLGSALIVWPETAIPEFLHHPEVQTMVARLGEGARAAGSEVVIGVPALDPDGRYYNALVSIGSASDRYDKRHLVPFGEYLPFKRYLGPLIDWFEVPMSDFSRGRAARPLLQVGPHLVGASICYEDVFPDQVREALPEAAWLINVSNDAWFGDSLAPHQHLEFARMRAVENGRDLVRATNTGVSAIIDHRGRVHGRLPLFERGTLTRPIQPRVGATPFSRLGSAPAVALALLMLLAALRLRRPRRGLR